LNFEIYCFAHGRLRNNRIGLLVVSFIHFISTNKRVGKKTPRVDLFVAKIHPIKIKTSQNYPVSNNPALSVVGTISINHCTISDICPICLFRELLSLLAVLVFLRAFKMLLFCSL